MSRTQDISHTGRTHIGGTQPINNMGFSREFRALNDMFTDQFQRLTMEMRAQSAPDKLTNFAGDGNKTFIAWSRAMERASVMLQADDDRMRVLTLQTLSGQAAEYAARVIKDSPEITWSDLKDKLRVRYSDTADMLYARQSLKQTKQQKRESVQNFYDRLLALAEESYTNADLQSTIVQQQLVDLFTDGLTNDKIAKKLIKQNPEKLPAALEIAKKEQQYMRTLEFRRRDVTTHKPMEIDMQYINSIQSQITSLRQMVNSIQNRINNLLPPQAHTFSNWPLSYAHSQQNMRYGKHNNQHLNPHYAPSQHNSHRSLPPPPNQLRPHTPFTRTNHVNQLRPKWTPNGRPVCLSSQKPGHLKRNCKSQTHPRQAMYSKQNNTSFTCKARRQPDKLHMDKSVNSGPTNVNHAEAQTPIASFTIGKLTTHAIIDTGADISIIADSFYKCIPNKYIVSKTLFSENEGNCRSATGHQMKCLCEATISFKLGNLFFTHKFTVIKHFDHKILIGSDFLANNNAKIDYYNRTLFINRKAIKLARKCDANKIHFEHYLIRTSTKIRIPPRSMVTFKGNIEHGCPKGDYLATMLDNCPDLSDQVGLTMPNTAIRVSNKNQRVTILSLFNYTDSLMTVGNNVAVATLERATILQPLSDTPEAANQANVNKPIQPDIGTAPEHERREICKLINEFSDIFVEKDIELGRTNVIEMRLDTGDTKPIRQRPYRVPLTQRPLVEKHKKCWTPG